MKEQMRINQKKTNELIVEIMKKQVEFGESQQSIMTSINSSEQINSSRYEEILNILQKLDFGQERTSRVGRNNDQERKYLRTSNEK